MDRTKYIGGTQSKRVHGLNEGIVRHMYESERMTVEEIAKEIQCQYVSVIKFMIKCGIPRRVPAKRDQRGDRNSSWKGEKVKYKPAHNRVYAARGRPQKCEHCGTIDPNKRYEWANISGMHHDPNDYLRLCRSCHCKFDNLLKNLGDYACVPPQNRTRKSH